MENILEYITNNNLDYLKQGELSHAVSTALNLDNAEVFAEISRLLKEGELVLTGGQKIIATSKLGLHKGRLIGNARGFAFCKLLDSDQPDVFIPHVKLKNALNKDIVLIKIITKDNKQEGEVFKIVERNKDNIVGTLLMTNPKFAFVKPDDNHNFSDIYVKLDKKTRAKHLDKVVVRIEKFDKDGKNPEGKIVEVLGNASNKGVDILSIIREYNLYEEFEPEVLKEARSVPDIVRPEDKEGRVDFTKEQIVTIDGEDARDFDDAISIDRTEDGWKLGVHIADVSHYVKIGSALDSEALKRGTSVYFCDRVLPMLPVELSNGICSLNPDVERLTMSVVMDIDSKGKVKDYKICEGVIKSCARMTYTDVYAILQNDEKTCKKYENLVQKFKIMEELHNVLFKLREKRGALDLDVPEAKIILNEFGAVVDVVEYERNTAHKLIESFMLLANEVVAKDICERKLPCVYRVHEQPDAIKMSNFFAFVSSLGLHIKGQAESVRPKDLQNLLTSIKGKDYETVVNKVMLRSLQKARYASENLGHFGLAAPFYCHFTSPIRRYPDLMVHRILKNCVLKKADYNRIEFYKDFVVTASIESSDREKLAETAERAVDDLKKAEFMQNKIGEVYDGIVSGVNTFGVFVELPNTVEGLCAEADLPFDVYTYIENQYLLKGNKNSFQLGQKVKVEVVEVNLQKRQINFKIVKNDEKS